MPICPACQEEVLREARFCGACGARMSLQDAGATASHIPDGPALSPFAGSPGSARFFSGQVLAGRYRIVSRLGKGGMGEIYRADDLRLGQSVALKFLPTEWVRDPQWLAKLHEEVRLTRQISHPNVCRVYDIAEAEGQTFLSMEFIDGEDLASLLRRIGRLPPDKGLEIARQLCMGLAAAHEQGVIHRDLKPANIMLDGRGHVRIADFGLARVSTRVTGAEARAGTPAYMAPEQLAGTAVTVRSDIYSLGLVLYEIFTGKKAFQASSPAELMKIQEASSPTSLSTHVSGVDPTVERVVLRCLERDPQKRPASVLAVAAALPGGDPLAAALAAGETPSPEIVAAAADSGVWTPHHALICLMATLLTLAGCVWLYGKGVLVGRVGLPESTDILRGKARDFLKKAGFDELMDNAIGFDHDEDYLREIYERDRSSSRWDRLEQSRPAAIYFWYRQSPGYLVPNLYYPYPGTIEAGRITLNEPAPLTPGMVHLKLDPRGQLLELSWVPPDKPPHSANWSHFFEAAGLDLDAFVADSPREMPPSFADKRLAWIEKSAIEGHTPIRVEAATFEDRPVFFLVLASPRIHEESTVGSQGALDKAGVNLAAILFSGVLVAAAFLAPRNWKQGRSDRKGAFRLAFGSFVILMVVWVFETHHVPSIDELRLLVFGLAYSLYWAGLLWMTYIALEPYVRQYLPESLITWTRLLAGQWRDPRLGRDLLLGTLCGVLMQVIDLAGRTAPAYLGATTPVPFWDWWIPNTHVRGYWIGNFLINLIYSFRWAFFYDLLLYLVLRVLLKRQLPTAIVYITISSALWIGTGASLKEPSWYWLFAVAVETLLYWLLVRIGIVPVITAIFVWYCVCFPLTADLSSWHVQSSLSAISAVVLLAGYGFYTSLAGRSLFQDGSA